MDILFQNDEIISLKALRIEEHVKGCTVFWKNPPPFDKLEWHKYRQQVIINSIPNGEVIRHTLVKPPIQFVNFDTVTGHSYDIQVSLILNDPNEPPLIARGFLKFVASKRFALNKKKFKPLQFIPLTVSISAIHCVVEWQEILEDIRGTPKLRFWSNGICAEVPLKPQMQKFEIRSIPGRRYFFEIRIYSNDCRLIAAGDIGFKAVHSQNELATLYSMAEEYCKSTPTTRFSYFYRTKPKKYFNFLEMEKDAIMGVYDKDESGHSASPINGQLDGLFFFAKLNSDGTFPGNSPFGDCRWFVKAETLFNPAKHRLYFADFYCNSGTSHYVTIVICEAGSAADKFCKKALIELDPENNSFLEYRYSYDYIHYLTNMKIWVEFYYTEDLPLLAGNFKDVTPIFQGSSTLGGVSNNKCCPHCNLYPDLNSILQIS